jgi:UDP-N-acetylmuramoyl-tripeptide--D-alanyl-D-alanine ligase
MMFLALASILFFFYYRLQWFLLFLQQDAYIPKRFAGWFFRTRSFDRKVSLFFVAVSVIFILFPDQDGLVTLGLSVGMLLFTWNEKRRLAAAKVRLHLTPRAERLLEAAFIVTLICSLPLLFAKAEPFAFTLGAVLLTQLLPLMLLLGYALLTPGEKKRQRTLIHEAKEKLHKIDPYVIGITGSYGKSSTKEALGQLLQIAVGPTAWPPEGINTDMGITRWLREQVNPLARTFVIEMAAYNRGSIARLCRLTPPHAAILTTIGKAHLERFGSQRAIQTAKAELAEAVPPDGILVCNGDDPLVREIAARNPKKTVLFYGLDPAQTLDCRLSSWNILETRKGLVTRFTLHWKGREYQGTTPLLGKTALSNMLAAFTMACALGGDPELVAAGLSTLQPLKNRLKIEKGNGVTYLHDAYNSNPVGFSSALEVLQKLEATRRILVTPGMIELKDEQHNEHEKIGRLAAEVCSSVYIVGRTNRDALKAGLRDAALPERDIHLFETREEAFAALRRDQKPGDAILIENDLPDLYEKCVKL